MNSIQSIINQLEAQSEEIKKRMVELKESDPFNDPDHAVDNAAVDTDVRDEEQHNVVMAEMDALTHRLNEIDEAIERAKKDSYGYCAKCGKTIPAGRLQLIPEAKYCVECESQIKK